MQQEVYQGSEGRDGRGAQCFRASGSGAVRCRGRAVQAAVAATLAAFSGGLAAEGPGLPSGTLVLAQAEEARNFDLPAQSLGAALQEFSRLTGRSVEAAPEALTGLTSSPVRGSYTAAEALERLLRGTGLQPRWRGDGTVALEAAAGSPEPLVVTATRAETPVSELTRAVTVVSRREVDQQKRIDRSVGEMLSKTVPGFSPSTEALTDFGQTLRGRTFLTLIDGVPQSTPLRDGRRSVNTVDADAIERIEVVRGGTAAYGFGATGGLVNIITRRPGDGALEGHSEVGAKVSTQHFDDSLEWHTSHSATGRTGAVDYLASGTFVQRNGRFDADGDRIPADPFGVQGGLADTDEWNALGKLGYEFDGARQRLELTVNHFRIFQDSDFAGLGTGDPEEREKTPAVEGNINAEDPGTENTLVNLQYRHRELAGSELRSQLYYGDLTTRFAKFPGFTQVEIRSEKVGGRLTVDTPLEVADYPLNLLWGLDYLHDETAQEGLDGPTATPEMRQNAVAGFAELDVPVSDWGLVRSGVRHEAIWVDVDDVVTRQGLFVEGGTLRFSETLFNATGVVFLTDRVELFGGFSQGFSLADLGRAIADGTANEATALESEAQKVDNYELGLRGHFQRWDAAVTGFYSESDNGTTFDADLNIVKQPEKIYGVEAVANVTLTERLRAGATAAWQEGRVDLDDDGDIDEDLPGTRIPPLKVTSYVEFSPFDWWLARLQGLYSGNRNPDSSQFGGSAVDDYIIFDLFSGFRLPYGELQIGVENLFNEDYFPVLNQAGALPFAFSKGPGRTVSATYAIEW